MNTYNKYAAALIPWSSLTDRFLRHGYREALPVMERIRKAADLGVLDGVEMMYPFEASAENLEEIRSALSEAGLALSALGIPISGESRFGKGTFTARDPHVRQAAISRVKEGMDVCAELNGDRVYFFLGQDGCDYPLEVDYEDAWNWMAECVHEIAAHRRDIAICLEYKPFEPRRHIFFGSVGSALHLMEQVNEENVGVLFDVGHALLAKENLGESIYLLQRAGRLFHVHFNDNYGGYDDDLVVGAVHFLPFVEAVYWLKRIGYKGWQSLDLFPYREDPGIAVKQSINFLKEISDLIDSYGLDATTELIHQGDGAYSAQELYRLFFPSRLSR
jgi:sugar phosphate isomerase/epimerase